MSENELMSFAEQIADKEFRPLYEFDLFMLDQLEGNDCAWYAFLSELSVRWGSPPDEEQEIVKQEIQLYAPTEG